MALDINVAVLPIKEIEISTKKMRMFAVHLEKYSQAHFECKLAAINLGSQLPVNAIFCPFTKGYTALAAYKELVSGIRSAIQKLDSTDFIAVVNNPCNTEFVTADEQKQALGQGVVVQVNGVNA